MKKPSLLLISSFLILSLSTAAFAATGSLGFTDVPDPSEGGKEYWYTPTVLTLQSLGIVEGKNGYYLPGDKVNRAEMASMLNKTIQYLQAPKGTEWDLYENDFYSTLYPSKYLYAPETYATYDGMSDQAGGECDSGLKTAGGGGGSIWRVDCFDSDEMSVEKFLIELDSDFGSEFYNVTEQDLVINGIDATLVTLSTGEIYSEYVFVNNFEKTFRITAEGLNRPDPDFERFYRSFKTEKVDCGASTSC